jgi:hypothetical protein
MASMRSRTSSERSGFSRAQTRIANAAARSAKARPICPRPITPTERPASPRAFA